jgi:hypothetical protein
MAGHITNNGQERTKEEVVSILFEVLSRNLPGRTEGNTILRQGTRIRTETSQIKVTCSTLSHAKEYIQALIQ